MKMIKAREKMTMTGIQIVGIAIDLSDDAEFEGEGVGVNELGDVCIAEVVARRGVRVVVVDRTCEEREVEIEGRAEGLEARNTELDKACEERDADCVERGRERELVAELEKVGRALNNVVVARVVVTVGISISKVLAGWMRREERVREHLHD